MSQQRALDAIESILQEPVSNVQRHVMITGPAGVGKTHVLIEIAKNLTDSKRHYKIICPTNKSKLNITNSLSHIANVILADNITKRIKTYCNFFRCYIDPFENTEETVNMRCTIPCCDDIQHETLHDKYKCLRQSKNLYKVSEEILLVEEVSLLDHVFFLMLRMTSVKLIIFIGDSNQIPPINSMCLSSKCSEGCEFTVFAYTMQTLLLTEQMRHIDKVSELINKFIMSIESNPISRSNIKKILEIVFKGRIRTLRELLPLHSPLITYHSKRTLSINRMLTGCRKEFQVDDWITIDRGGTDKLPVGSVDYIKFIEKQKLICKYLEEPFTFLVIETSSGNTIHIIDESCRSEYIEHAKKLISRWQGNPFPINNLVREHLSQIRYAYCTTAHKAQGLTFTTSFIDYMDILSCKNNSLCIKLLYSAMTRASQDIYLVKIPDYFPLN